MNTVIIKKEMAVPLDVLIDVIDIILEHEICHQITATDSENNCVTVEVQYERDERDVIREIEDVISDYEESDDDENEEEEEN